VSVIPIRLLGDPVLRTPARPVVDFDAELRGLVADLTETMLEAPGAGLAAPQLGVGLRVFTYNVIGHLVNPVIELSEDYQDGDEGCLSIPGLKVPCRRAAGVVARGMSMFGEPVTIEGSAMLARCIQHETDHLDGIIFLDRLDDATRADALRQIAESDWAGERLPILKASPHATSMTSTGR